MRTRPLAVFLLLAAGGCASAARGAPEVDDREYVQVGELELSAVIEQEAGEVYSMVEIMNTSDGTVRLEYPGPCAVSPTLFRPVGSTREAVWTAEAWGTANPMVCPPSPIQLDIPAGTLARLIAPILVQTELQGDSLPPGRYPTAVRFRMLQPRDTTLLLWSGEVQLGSRLKGRMGAS
jgi:hypothetical protein